MKLEAWKQLLHDTGTTMFSSPQCNQDVATLLGATAANVAANGMRVDGGDVVSSKVNGTGLDGADMCSAIAVLTAVCNINPVIFLKYPQSFTFSGIGVGSDSETLAGRIGNAGMQGTCAPNVLANLLKIDEFYAQKFARLVGMLDGITEGDGTLLDNTATVWFQEMSDGCARNLNNLPIIQAGSCGGYFKTGRAVNVDDGSPTLSKGNSEIFCADGASDQVDGVNQASGTDPLVGQRADQQILLQLDERARSEGGRRRLSARGRLARSDLLWHVRQDRRLHRRQRQSAQDPRPRRLRRPQGVVRSGEAQERTGNMRQSLNRRIFLKGLGGACVAAPFLGSIVERGAKGRVRRCAQATDRHVSRTMAASRRATFLAIPTARSAPPTSSRRPSGPSPRTSPSC